MKKAMKLTKEEKQAIAQLKELSFDWPKTLWLFSASGTLCVMKKKDGKRQIFYASGYDPDFSVDTIDIENDGGDFLPPHSFATPEGRRYQRERRAILSRKGTMSHKGII